MYKQPKTSETPKITITLSWPDKSLWINRSAGRSHWKKADAKNIALNEGSKELLNSLQGEPKPQWKDTSLSVFIEACAPTKAHYDLDNFVGALKHQLDGICATFGINDNQFDRLVVTRGEPVKGGRVTVEISTL